MSTETNVLEKEVPEQNLVKNEPVRIRPVTDVYRDENAVRILLDLPGATDETVEVCVHDGELTVKADVKRDETDFRYYERSFRMDRRLDPARVEANLQRGVLQLRIPFREELRPKRIPVYSGE